MAVEGWIWRWGWGRRCSGRPGLPGPGPGPTTPLLLLLLLGLVAADITDGNSEHLKREHSLIKPYQGEAWGGNECWAESDGWGRGCPLSRAGSFCACTASGKAFPGMAIYAPVCACLCPQGWVPAPCPSGISKAALYSRASTYV